MKKLFGTLFFIFFMLFIKQMNSERRKKGQTKIKIPIIENGKTWYLH